jgi:galactokinase
MQSIIVKAPGRINLIGEHTDYNNGFVLPAAIQKAAIVSISKRADDQIHLTAIDIPDELIIESVANLCVQEKHWANYVIGVIVQFIKRQKFPTGFNLAITSDVPIGAGLSSSAAIECAIAFGLNELFQFDIDKMELTFMTQKAEHEFAGVECGIMDQFASLYGKKDQVVFLDCESMEYTYFPLDLKEYQIVLFDTGVKHALATSEYNTRRKECALGIGLIQEKYPKVDSLRNATLEMLNECIDKSVDPIIFKRAKYVIEEIERTKSATQDLISNDLKSFGQKMFLTHEGLSKLYEVSCPELDFLVTFLQNNDAVLGARMMGGGFGGCTLNIIKSDEAKNIINEITQAYLLKTSKQLQHYIVSIEDGASVVSH